MLVKQGWDPDSTSLEPAPPCSAIRMFLSMWLQDHPEDFLVIPDLETLRNFLEYVKMHFPSTEVTRQTEELLLVAEEQKSKKGEDA